MTDNNNTKDDRNKLSAVWNAAPSGIELDDKITIIENWSYEALKYLPPWIMPEAIESDGYYFVAHSRKDFKIVYTDILRLESVGVDIWYDRSMEPGRNWQEIAERMMNRQECKGVIVYGTVNSMASKPVQIELLVADRLGKNIIFINHGEDSETTAAKDLYEKAKKTLGADGAHEETSEEDRKRVKDFEDLLDRIGNADITYIDIAVSSKTKRDKLNLIKSEGILLYDKSDRDCGVITGVKYLGVREVKIPQSVAMAVHKKHEKHKCDYEVGEIAPCAFANCRLLEKIELPSSLVEIKQHAFFGCKNLTKVYLGKKVTFIAENAFDNCTGLEEFVAEEMTVEETEKSMRYSKFFTKDGVLYQRYGMDRTQPFRVYGVPPRLRGEISLPYGLRKVRRYAFSNCKNLVSIAIPTTVESIGDSAFRGCSSLAYVTIPDSVESIGDNAFRDCNSIDSISIPDRVVSIGEAAFKDCTALTSVTIGNSVTRISFAAFSGCGSLASVFMGNGVRIVDSYAFYDCTSLTSITIPDSVTAIESGAFQDCTSLISVTIPPSVAWLGSLAFDGCECAKTYEDGVAYIDGWAVGWDAARAEEPSRARIRAGTRGLGNGLFCADGSSETPKLSEIVFDGTVNEWKNVKKHSWLIGCEACRLVRCQDGEVIPADKERVERGVNHTVYRKRMQLLDELDHMFSGPDDDWDA